MSFQLVKCCSRTNFYCITWKKTGKKPAQCCAACLDSCQSFYLPNMQSTYAQLFLFFYFFFPSFSLLWYNCCIPYLVKLLLFLVWEIWQGSLRVVLHLTESVVQCRRVICYQVVVPDTILPQV